MGPAEPRRGGANLIIGVAAALLALFLGWAAWMSRAPAVVTNTEVQSSKPVYPAEWLRLPSEEEVDRAYPDRARREDIKVPVMVNMGCAIRKDGGLTACVVYEESLPDYGFGDAALKLAEHFEAKTKAADGSSLLGLHVGIPLKFNPPCAMAAKPTC